MVKTPEQYLEYIDDRYKAARLLGISRLHVKWGTWSRAMNVEVRNRIDTGDPEALKLKYVFVYWINRSQLLELHHKHPRKWSRVGKKKRLVKEGQEIRKSILMASNLDDMDGEELQRRLLSGVLGGKA